MKKILGLVLGIILLLGLGACAPSTQEYDDTELIAQNELLEARLDAIEEEIASINLVLDSIKTTTGLNGMESIYYNRLEQLENAYATLSTYTLLDTKETFDKNKDAPEYIKDEFGDYVSMKDLARMLKLKYFNATPDTYDKAEMGSKALFWFKFESTMTNEETVARTILLIEELRNYDFYVMSSNELEIYIFRIESYDHQTKINIPLTVILNSYFEITPDGIYNGDFEMELVTESLNYTELMVQYNALKASGDYNGYVLNYTP